MATLEHSKRSTVERVALDLAEQVAAEMPVSASPDTADAVQQARGWRALLAMRDFRLLWLGEAISMLGDQFYMIALPWLVLQLTGDAFAMGIVLALGGIPRAAFMLIGGAISDRLTPRRVMLVSNVLRLGLVGLLAGLVLGDMIELWMLYGFALAFGLADAFFYPASSAIVPRIVPVQHLEPANAITSGTAQLTLFLGPVLAGIMIALVGSTEAIDGETVADLQGIGVAFAFDAVTFLASAATLLLISDPIRTAATAAAEDMLGAIRSGLRFVREDVSVRTVFLLIAVANFLINGPFAVGIPYLAKTRFPEGAAAYGTIMSLFGGGMLLGTVIAGFAPRPRAGWLGAVLGVVWSGMGIGILALGLTDSTALAAAIACGMGLANGYVSILFITWLQRRTPGVMMGRVMSVFMLTTNGLLPISTALMGGLVAWNVTVSFVGAGGLMTLIVLLTLVGSPAVRRMDEVVSA